MRTLIIMVTLLVAPTWVAPTVPTPPIVNNVEEKKENCKIGIFSRNQY